VGDHVAVDIERQADDVFRGIGDQKEDGLGHHFGGAGMRRGTAHGLTVICRRSLLA